MVRQACGAESSELSAGTRAVRNLPRLPIHTAVDRPIAALVAARTGFAPGAGAPDAANAAGICWLAPAVLAAKALLPALQRHLPDVLLLAQDIFTDIDAQALVQLPWRFPELRILLIAQAPGTRLHDQVLRCRFHGELSADCSRETCVKAIRAVHHGEIWLPRADLSRAVAQGMVARVFDPTPAWTDSVHADNKRGELSRREKEIVELLRQGMTNKEIACRLDIMEDTVKKHLQGVFGKLGVRRRALVALGPGIKYHDHRLI